MKNPARLTTAVFALALLSAAPALPQAHRGTTSAYNLVRPSRSGVPAGLSGSSLGRLRMRG
jgi:hypothetical protein